MLTVNRADKARRDSEREQAERAGHWLYQAREAVGLTQDELGARLGIHGATVSAWENGRTKKVPERHIAGLARALGKGQIEVRRALGLFVPDDAVDDTRVADVLAAILSDPHLLPEAKEHLRNQYRLLLRLQSAEAPRVTPESLAAELQAQGEREVADLSPERADDTP